MNKKFDNILLGTLWLIAAMLGACFWFNSQFGFDIFSKSHWHHLAYMQASQQPVQTSFYISLVTIVVVTLVVLHILVRPKFRKIKIKQTQPQSSLVYVHKTSQSSQRPQQTQNNTNSQPQKFTQYESMARPPRLNIPQATSHPQNVTYVAAPRITSPQSGNDDLRKIFTSSGYVVTKNPNMPNSPISLVAIGSSENLWIGGVGISIQQMQTIINKLEQIFSDTLEEIMINLNSFIISPNSTNGENSGRTLIFNSTQELYQYMMNHKNISDASDQESIKAFETYINTVMDYIGKI